MKYTPNHLTYETSKLTSDQLAVFSEIYYNKGWNAYIDGQAKPYVRANYVLRAMVVPAGSHKIEFKFEPQSYVTGEKVSLAGSVLLLLIIVAALYFEFRKKKGAPAEQREIPDEVPVASVAAKEKKNSVPKRKK